MIKILRWSFHLVAFTSNNIWNNLPAPIQINTLYIPRHRESEITEFHSIQVSKASRSRKPANSVNRDSITCYILVSVKLEIKSIYSILIKDIRYSKIKRNPSKHSQRGCCRCWKGKRRKTRWTYPNAVSRSLAKLS